MSDRRKSTSDRNESTSDRKEGTHHSLSYQATSFTKLSDSWMPADASTMQVRESPLKSVLTTASVVNLSGKQWLCQTAIRQDDSWMPAEALTMQVHRSPSKFVLIPLTTASKTSLSDR